MSAIASRPSGGIDTMGIELTDVGFAYGARAVLASVRFHVPDGQIWALVGRSGSGKTTLLHIIAGLYTPTQGTVALGGEASQPGRIKGVVFQDDCLLGWLTAEQNLLFPAHRRAGPEARTRAERMLEAVELAGCGDLYPYEMSTGMRKRLEFARALLADGDHILADEPFGTVDAVTRRNLWTLWRQLRTSHPRTGILCTHDPEEAIRLCDAVVPLQSGRPSTCGDPFVVPASIRALDMTEETEDLWSLKRQVIEALKERLHG